MSNRMVRFLAVALALAVALPSFGADKQGQSDKDAAAQAGLRSGDTLPGPFQVLSVTGPRTGKFLSPVVDYGVKPFVLVFVKDTKNLDNLGKFLQKLNALIAKHPDARLGACVTFLEDGGYRKALATKGDADGKGLAKAIDDKEAIESKLRDWAGSSGLKLDRVFITVDHPGGPEQYRIDPEASTTVLVCDKLQLAADRVVFKAEPKQKDWDDVLKPVEKLVARAEREARPKK